MKNDYSLSYLRRFFPSKVAKSSKSARYIRERLAWRRRLVVTTLAVTIAWSIGSIFNNTDATVAAILVLITLRVSLHSSANEAFGQFLGVGIGVLMAIAAGQTVGFGMVSIALIVVFSLLVSRILQLGDEGAANIAITSLIVLGPGSQTDRALDRIWGTVIGISVAVVASYFMQNSTPVRRTTQLVSDLQLRSSRLLESMAMGIKYKYNEVEAAKWLGDARKLVSQIPAMRSQASEAIRYARWSPLAQSDEAEAAHLRHIEAEHIAVQVRTLGRTLYDLTEKRITLPDEVFSYLSEALQLCAKVLEIQSLAVIEDANARLSPESLKPIRARLTKLGERLITLDDATLVAAGGAMFSCIERVVDTLSGSSGALTEVDSIEIQSDTAVRVVEAVSNPVRAPQRYFTKVVRKIMR